MPKKEQQNPSGDTNLLWATVLLIGCATVAAGSVAYISTYILDAFSSSSTMALLITDAGLRSDDSSLERQLTTATTGLKACRDLGWALAVGCVGVGVAVFLRLRRQNAS